MILFDLITFELINVGKVLNIYFIFCLVCGVSLVMYFVDSLRILNMQATIDSIIISLTYLNVCMIMKTIECEAVQINTNDIRMLEIGSTRPVRLAVNLDTRGSNPGWCR
jgi:hypothetical protein